jgi:hypothetical protein
MSSKKSWRIQMRIAEFGERSKLKDQTKAVTYDWPLMGAAERTI